MYFRVSDRSTTSSGWLLLLLLVLLLEGCASTPQTATLLQQARSTVALNRRLVLEQVPFFAQQQYQCGPASLAMLLDASGLAVTPDALVPLVYLPARQGSLQQELVAATRGAGRLAQEIPPTLQALFAEVSAGHPVLVLQNLGLAWYPRWHYAVVIGFDVPQRRIILNSGVLEHYQVSLATFERTWARSDHWGMVALVPGVVPATADAQHYFNEVVALEKHVRFDAALAAYQGGLARWPADVNLQMGIANLHYANSKPVAAAQWYRQVIAQQADYAPAYNNLAQVQAELGETDAALANARKAVELGGPYLGTYRSTLQELMTACACNTASD